MTEYLPIAGITVVCYLIGTLVKNIGNIDKWIPSIVGVSGAGLALALFFTNPEVLGVSTWIDALAIGIVSGLASTGANQIVKQLGE